jgi:hypothetical protein
MPEEMPQSDDTTWYAVSEHFVAMEHVGKARSGTKPRM